MSRWYCDNPREHQREAERDFERRGRPDREYESESRFGDACARAYMEKYESLEREQRDQREQDEAREAAAHAAEMRAYREREEERMIEDEQLQQEYDRQAQEEHYWAQEDAHFAALAQEEEALRVSDQSENPATTSGADCSDERDGVTAGTP